MKVHIAGAAGEVTGSAYLVETGKYRVLVDAGMFQGNHREDDAKNRRWGAIDPKRLDAVVLTHAHLDHSGRLPLLRNQGFRGPIFATPATIDIAELILADAAHLQTADLARQNRRRQRAGRPPLEPLYTPDDLDPLWGQFRPVNYGQAQEVVPGVNIRFVDAGHILGSASVEMKITENGATKTISFSGDLGPKNMPFLRDPTPLPGADLVFLESTYGDRDHRALPETVAEFKEIIQTAQKSRGRILIPAFAVGRTQLILHYLAEMSHENLLRETTIYLDSPMAIKATELYVRHIDILDDATQRLRHSGQFAKDLAHLKTLPSAEDSRALNDSTAPAIVIAGSGMCEGGRILHHLKHHLWRKETAVLIVGFQPNGTLGRQLVNRAKRVRVLGQEVAVNASIHTLGGFSAHAGQSELVEWFTPAAASKPAVVLTHGEDGPRSVLRAVLETRFGVKVACPRWGAVVTL